MPQYKYVDETDAALLARARHGDEAAFLTLYRRHRTPVRLEPGKIE
jgi:hypothetical protein